MSLESLHISRGINWYIQCDVCDYSATTSGDLKSHKLIHTGEIPYKCDICDYSTAQSGDLKAHKLIHSGKKHYKCDTCDYLPNNAWFWGYYAHYESKVPENMALIRLVHHFSRKYCIIMSIYCRCNVFAVIINQGRNSVEQNAVVPDNSDRALLRHQALPVLLQSPDNVNQWISKDQSCDALKRYNVWTFEETLTNIVYIQERNLSNVI